MIYALYKEDLSGLEVTKKLQGYDFCSIFALFEGWFELLCRL